MKFFRKKWVLVVLGIVLCLLLSGCSKTEKDTVTSNVKGITESIWNND